jgi:hypothetical protein
MIRPAKCANHVAWARLSVIPKPSGFGRMLDSHCLCRYVRVLEQQFAIEFEGHEARELSELARRRNQFQHFQITGNEALQSLAPESTRRILATSASSRFIQRDPKAG